MKLWSIFMQSLLLCETTLCPSIHITTLHVFRWIFFSTNKTLILCYRCRLTFLFSKFNTLHLSSSLLLSSKFNYTYHYTTYFWLNWWNYCNTVPRFDARELLDFSLATPSPVFTASSYQNGNLLTWAGENNTIYLCTNDGTVQGLLILFNKMPLVTPIVLPFLDCLFKWPFFTVKYSVSPSNMVDLFMNSSFRKAMAGFKNKN